MVTKRVAKSELYNAYFYLKRNSPYFHHLELISSGDVEYTITLFKSYLEDFGIAELDIRSEDRISTLKSGRYLVSGWYNYNSHILGEKVGIYAIRKLSELGILRAFYVVMLKDFLSYKDSDDSDYMKRLILGEEGRGVLSFKDILGYTEYEVNSDYMFNKNQNKIKYTPSLGKEVANILKEFIEEESTKNNIKRYVNLNPVDYESEYSVLDSRDESKRRSIDYLYTKPFPKRISNILYWIISHLKESIEVSYNPRLDISSKFEEIPSLYDGIIKDRLLKVLEVKDEI